MNQEFSWAVNDTKLTLAIRDVTEAKKLDPKVEISEETIKAAYVKRGGLLLEDAPEKVKKAITKKRKSQKDE